VSGSLRARQQHTLEKFGDLVHWVQALPDQMQGVVVGNEVLDAMPVKLLHRLQGVWHERGVVLAEPQDAGEAGEGAPPALVWQDRVTSWRASIEPEGPHDYLTEIHPQGESFIRTLADKLTAGAAFFIDYGFPEHEYYHPQRSGGTVMCHQQHQADPDPLQAVGRKDITAHVNFTGVALAAQDAGLSVLGYTSQARFLINCGLAQRMESAPLATRVKAQTLIMEHEMGELFKVIGLCCGEPWQALGFAQGDRTHTL
jgi:SAM-dependent MidA family methyltransferase